MFKYLFFRHLFWGGGFLLLWACVPKAKDDFDMKAELRHIYDNESYELSFLRADKGVESLEQKLKEAGDDSMELMVHLAITSLMSGDVEKSIGVFSELLPEWFGDLPDQPEIDFLWEWQALAYFRQGEITNCIENHNEQSCVFPLTGNGLHKNQKGSLKAIEIYSGILKRMPSHYTAQWMLNLAYMTLGKYPDEVPEPWLIRFDRFEDNEQFPWFRNVSSQLGVDMDGLYGGAIADDFNGDGLIDIFATSALLSDNVRLFLRNPYGGFYDATSSMGLEGISGGVHAVQADFNNDGFLDILILRGGWQMEGGCQPNSLLRNNGDGTFSDITKQAGLLDYSPTHTAVWADFDNDGYLDLFIGHETGSYDQVDFPEQIFEVPLHPSKFFKNNGDETFTEISRQAGINISKWVKGSVFLDYNNDGKQDLYISCYNGDNYLFCNESSRSGHFKFSDVTVSAGVKAPYFSFPVVALDVNNDGWEDLFVSGYYTSMNDLAEEFVRLEGAKYPSITYINNKNGTFTAWNKDAEPAQSILAMGINAGDLDNDGYLDLYCGTGSGDLRALYPNVVLKNNRGISWSNVTSVSGLGHLQKAHSIAMCDFDNDGDLDIYLNLGALYSGDRYWNALFENSGNDNNWVNIQLKGSTSNASAIGARIEVQVEDGDTEKSFYRVVHNGSSYGGSPLRQHFGLDTAKEIKAVIVRWPSGKVDRFSGLEANQFYLIAENNREIKILYRKPISLKSENGVGHKHP